MILNYDKKTRTVVQAPTYNNEPDGFGRPAVSVRADTTYVSPAKIEENQAYWDKRIAESNIAQFQQMKRRQDALKAQEAQLANKNQTLKGFQQTGPTSAELLIKAEMIRRARPQADFSRYEMHKDGSDFGAADFEQGQIVGSTLVRSLPMTYKNDFAPVQKGPYYNSALGYMPPEAAYRRLTSRPGGRHLGAMGDDATDAASSDSGGFWSDLWSSAQEGVTGAVSDPSLTAGLLKSIIPSTKPPSSTTVVVRAPAAATASQVALPGGINVSKTVLIGAGVLLLGGLAFAMMRRR